jgi:hypothetical protein
MDTNPDDIFFATVKNKNRPVAVVTERAPLTYKRAPLGEAVGEVLEGGLTLWLIFGTAIFFLGSVLGMLGLISYG